jgi:hypothetical protein
MEMVPVSRYDLVMTLVALVLAAGVVFLLFRGQRQGLRRVLLALPDFDGKDRLAHEGRGEWVETAVLVVAYFGVAAIASRTNYELLVWNLLMVAMGLGVLVGSLRRDRDAILAGNLVHAADTRVRIHRKTFDLEQWLAGRDRVVRRTRLFGVIAGGAMALVYTAMIPSTYSLDRAQAEWAELNTLQSALPNQLAAPDVTKVYVVTPIPEPPLPWPHRMDFRAELLSHYGSDHVLIVELKPDASEARAQERLAAGQQALAGLQRKERWAIWVEYRPRLDYPTHPPLKGWYEPGAVATP